MISPAVIEGLARRLNGLSGRMDSLERSEAPRRYANELYAEKFNNDLETVLDMAVALGGNVRVILQPGTTYTAPASEYIIDTIDNVTIQGNGATINCPDGEEAAFRLQTCDGWVVRDVIFAAGADTAACKRTWILEEGCGTIKFYNCEFYGFTNQAIRGRGGSSGEDNYSLVVDTCLFHDLGDQLWGGSGIGTGVDGSRFRYMSVVNSEFHTIGTLATSHGIYPSRGTEDVGAAGSDFYVAGCRFRDIPGFGIKFNSETVAGIANAVAVGNQFNDCPGVVFTRVENAVAVGNAVYEGEHILIRVDGAGAKNVNFTGNSIYNTGSLTQAAIYVSGNLGGGVIANNYAYGVKQFINNLNEIDSCLIADNTVPYCTSFLESLATRNIVNTTIQGNRFGNVGPSHGIHVLAGSNCTIVDNEQINPPAGTLAAMIEVRDVDRFIIDNNTSRNATLYRTITGLTNSLLSTGWYWDQSSGPRRWRSNFADSDATPSVLVGDYFRTQNTGATTITAFDDAIEGKEFWVLVNDANTTLDFTASNLSGNNGVDYVCASGDMLRCFKGASKTHVWISEV